MTIDSQKPPEPSVKASSASKRTDLERSFRVVPARLWLLGTALALMGIGALVWAAYGQTPIAVKGSGLMVPEQGLYSVSSTETGTLMRMLVVEGAPLVENQRVAEVATKSGMRIVRSAVRGTVLDVSVSAVGAWVVPGDPIVSVLPASDRPESLMWVSQQEAGNIQVGMPVQVSPVSASAVEYGTIPGRVIHIDALPSDHAELVNSAAGDQALARQLQVPGADIRVVVELTTNPANVSGYEWTHSSGPPAPIRPATLTTSQVLIGEQRLLPRLTGKSG